MIRLTKGQILMLHTQLIEATGGCNGIRDEGSLDSAIESPFHSFGGEELYPGIHAKAARLCYGLVKNHAMIDGNKRIGTHAMLVFLAVNGYELRYTLSLDKTRYKLTFSLQDASKRARHEILTMCSGNLTQQQLTKENISITDNAESIQGIIQRLKGFDVAYEVTPPFPYEVEGWDGFMDRDFLEELAKNNPGLDIDGVLREQMEDIKKYGD